MSEKALLNEILIRFSRGTCRLLRANAGMAWTGKPLKRTPTSITLGAPRPFHGMAPGVSDLVGWQSIVITPEMVGRRVAVFAAVEVKSERGAERAEQAAFREAVTAAGGVAVVARSLDEVGQVLHPNPLPPERS
jgi:hypothetical protein